MRTWVLLIALGIALLNASPARADVPQQIIEQTADLRVQEVELRHLTAIGKLTGQDAFAKKQTIEAQVKTLWLPYRALSPDEDARAERAIDRIVKDKLALLDPQWTQEDAAFKAARKQRNKQLYAESEDDARRAAELQRERGVLQKELAAGTLTRDAFTAKDKQASDAIAAFRKKYDAEGAEWSTWFDQRYRVLLEAALKNPDTRLPQPGVPAAPPGPTTAQAEVPQQTINQIADLRVQAIELKHLTAIGKLTGQDAFAKKQAIEAQIKTIVSSYRALSSDEDARVQRAIDRLVTDKLALLSPQWDQEEAAFKTAKDQHNAQLSAEMDDDARAAAELQRQRVVLQKELAAGTLARDAFDTKDKQASDALAAFRKKYDDAGGEWSHLFDQRYRVLLQAALKNSDTPLPQPSVTAETPGPATAPPDFAADVQIAADLAVKRQENQYKFEKKQINQSLMATTDPVIDLDLARLKARYDALVPKRGAEFVTAYLQAAAPRIQALNAQYYPERYRPAAVSVPAVRQNAATPLSAVPIKEAASWGTMFRALAYLGAGIGFLVFGIWWWLGGVTKFTKGLSPEIHRFRHAIAALIMLALVFYLVGAIAGAVIGAISLGIWWLRGAKKRKEKKEWQLYKASNEMAMNKLGSTTEEKELNIDSMFDKRDSTLSVYMHDLKKVPAEYLRPIAGMSPKEREALRANYHLYNFGMVSDWDFYFDRMGIICGDGKALANGALKGRIDLKTYPRSVETAVNSILGTLTDCVKKYPDHPALRKLSSRLHGDGGDLVPGAPLKSGAKGEPVEAGLVLGLDEKAPDRWWYYDGEGSLITVAPPGSGKTQCQVFPNLLMWKGAAVVLDVKGEIYEQTSKWRRENVGPVYKFSPLDPATSHGFNPLTEVRADPDYLWEDARFLADMMIVPSGAKDPFWETRARDVLTAAIARVCLEEDVAKRSMGDVLDILHGVGWEKFVAYLEARVDFHSMTRAGHSLANMEPKTRDGVLQSALSSMSAWDGERIARATRKSDWSPLDLRGDKNPTIYICLKPNEVDSYISVLRVFIAQHIRTLTSTKVSAHGVHPILFILDELPRLKHMPPVEEALEIGRQYGIKLWLFAQSLGQLANAYPNAEGMIGGCAIRMFMNPSLHDETAKKVSDDIGSQDSVIDGTRVTIVEPNVLAGPDYKDLVIVMAANAKAARLKKYFAYADEGLKARMMEGV